MKIWMHQREIDMIQSYLKPTFRMFEWGSGGSTLQFGAMVKEYHSVEHDRIWYDEVRKAIRLQGLANKIFIHHVPENISRTIPTLKEQFTDYINFFPENLNKQDKFDAVLVDGRARQWCAESALEFLASDGLLFCHDYFEREHYKSIEEHYELIDAVKDTGQTLAVFKPKGFL